MPKAARKRLLRAQAAPRKRAAAVFRQDWDSYGAIVKNNYLHHREAYAALHRVLVEEMASPFRFLDIACGDASASVVALAGTKVSHYRGIDLSEAGLERAEKALGTLSCSFELEHRDFAEALADEGHSDVAWIGLSLHHFRTPQKLALMREARRIVGADGKFLIYECASPGAETREAWLRRWDLQRPDWNAYSDAQWDSITMHVRANDFPETHATWLRLGEKAGFPGARCLYISPTDLFRLYCFDTR